MTDEDALAATEAFARKVAAEAARAMRRSGDVIGMFAAVHRGIAAAYSLGCEVGRVGSKAARRAAPGGRRVVARVQHECCVCGAAILPGESAVRESGIENGEPYARYRCWACS